MAAAIVRSNGAEAASLTTGGGTFTTPTSGNALFAFVLQTVAALGADPTLAGYTMDSNIGQAGANTQRLYLFTRTADGTESSITPTAGSGGTITSIEYFEVSGITAPYTYDASPTLSNNHAAGTTITSSAYSTSKAGSIVFFAVNFGINGNGGTATMTCSSGDTVTIGTGDTVSRHLLVGAVVPASPLSAATFTAGWTTSHGFGWEIYSYETTPPANTSGILSIL